MKPRATADSATFAAHAMRFHRVLGLETKLPRGVTVMNPFREGQALALSDAYLREYYSDARARVLVFGINPGRFGAGLTGVAFTDPVALQDFCGIKNDLPRKRETSSEFIYKMIEAYGGVREFMGRFYLGATCPLGFLKDGVNYNFYDDPRLQRAVTPFIVESVRAQIGFGCRRDVAIVLGTGKLKTFWEKLNEEHGFFARMEYLEHPRFIMQYKRKRIEEYVDKYVDELTAAIGG
jgi:hypothetical protein